ncbi:MAG: thiamine pyrophosphate-dependent enzyme, partial [Desulfurispora sp.]|uniref:thiamine pyrophosphate-dependent enzyme n=1 Tax=Desulfurispora sp. TaxID=3014275 RepID=UPI00404AD911
MTVKLLMGNQAIAYGALEAGVQVAAAYPGTPSSEILATLAELAGEHKIYAEWSVNEKVALETAAGASYAGARALAAMKQVGLNVALDPLMSLAYIGIKGGLVLAVADDPGPHSSQTEQDSRFVARLAKLPVLDPATPREAREMARYAFDLSEQLGLPVLLRPTTRVCHVCQDVPLSDNRPARRQVAGFDKDPRWVILPSLTARRHPWLNARQDTAREILQQSPFNRLEQQAAGPLGIIAGGVSTGYVLEALEMAGIEATVLHIGTPYPLPEQPVRQLLHRVRHVLVVEELYPVVEEQVALLAWREQLPVTVSGKLDGLVPREGELDVDKVRRVLEQFARRLALDAARLYSLPAGETPEGKKNQEDTALPDGTCSHQLPAEPGPETAGKVQPAAKTPCSSQQQIEAARTASTGQTGSAAAPALPLRPPVLCAGCPHRASFYAARQATADLDVIFCGDIGCYTLGVMPPLSATHTCLCMGAGITIAAGLKRAEPQRKPIAFIGDSTFFHTGLPGLINAVYNGTDITVVVLDNRTTAMTGHQPHPGLDRTASGTPAPALD